MAGNSEPPSRNIRFGLSAKMPRAAPYVHFSWPGNVAISLGQFACTSYGPETSCAPIAPGTALNDGGAAVCASAGDVSRSLAAQPTITPTAIDNPIATVLLTFSSLRKTAMALSCMNQLWPLTYHVTEPALRGRRRYCGDEA